MIRDFPKRVFPGILVICFLFPGPTLSNVSHALEDSLQHGTPNTEDTQVWRGVIAALRANRDSLSELVQELHTILVRRASAEDSELLARLEPEPPKPIPWGYGLLPEILPNSPVSASPPTRRRYSLRSLRSRYDDVTAHLEQSIQASTEANLQDAVEDYEHQRSVFRNLEKHLTYHDFWQGAALDYQPFFASKATFLEIAEGWRDTKGSSSMPFPKTVIDRLAPFLPTPGLSIAVREPACLVLRLPIVTDIDDQEFLDRFEKAVEAEFANAETTNRLEFRLDLEIARLSSHGLYQGSPPERGEHIDEKQHLKRFPEGALVITTGARSTHASIGRSVIFGTTAISGRTLAHEVCHLLGFNDAYLRAHLPDQDGDFGVVFIEWSGLSDDLMGAPGTGAVSPEMVDTLVRAYFLDTRGVPPAVEE